MNRVFFSVVAAATIAVGAIAGSPTSAGAAGHGGGGGGGRGGAAEVSVVVGAVCVVGWAAEAWLPQAPDRASEEYRRRCCVA